MSDALPVVYLARRDRTIAEYAADIWHAKPCPVS